MPHPAVWNGWGPTARRGACDAAPAAQREIPQRVSPRAVAARGRRRLTSAVPIKTARRSELLPRLALVVVGLVLALLLEAGLQIGAAYVRVTGRAVSTQWTTRGGRMLCLGDSNTYGIWVDGRQAYPAVLQQLWNERAPSQRSRS